MKYKKELAIKKWTKVKKEKKEKKCRKWKQKIQFMNKNKIRIQKLKE